MAEINSPSSDSDSAKASVSADAAEAAEESAASAAVYDRTDTLALPLLNEVLATLARGGSVEEVLEVLVEKARLLLRSSSTAIALLEPDRESVSFVAAAGEEAVELLGTRVHLADTLLGQTARTGEPFLAHRPSSALQTDPPIPARMESAAVIAIFDEGKPIGALAALNKQGKQPFDGNDFLALSTLASAASVALGQARLRARDQRQSRELSVLYDAVRRVSGQLSMNEVLQAVVEQTALHLENSGVAVFLANDERTHLYIAESAGLTQEEQEVALSATLGVGGSLLAATQPLLLEFLEAEGEEASPGATRQGRLRCESPFPGRSLRSGLVAPIRSGDETHGFVLVASQQAAGVYTSADANLLFALASQAAVALENSWLYEDATRRAEEATALYELSQAVTSTLNLSDVLGRVADATLTLLQVDKFALFLYDRNSDRLQLVVSRGLPEGAEERLRPRIGEGIPGWVMEFETPTAVQDVAADHRNASAPLHPEGIVSMTCMPLQVGSATIGAMAAMSAGRRLFTVGEMELLYTIANQAAIAIENARMYADVRHKSVELRQYFHRVARALGSSRDPHRVPELIASLTREILTADRCALYILERGALGEPQRRLAAAVGFLAEARSETPLLMAPDTPTGWVALKVRPLAVENLQEDERFVGRYDRPARGEVHSYLGVPLRSGTEVVGVLEVYSRERRIWQPEEVRLLLTFATQATVAVKNARLAAEREQADRVNRLLERLLEMTDQTPGPDAEAVVAMLALGLNAPVVTLYRSNNDWLVGPASISRDAIPLEALLGAVPFSDGWLPEAEREALEGPVVVARSRDVALGVLLPPDTPRQPLTRSLLELAARLLERASSADSRNLPAGVSQARTAGTNRSAAEASAYSPPASDAADT